MNNWGPPACNLGCKQSLFYHRASLELSRQNQRSEEGNISAQPYINYACNSLFIENDTQNKRQPLEIWGNRGIYFRPCARKKRDKYTRVFQMNAPLKMRIYTITIHDQHVFILILKWSIFSLLEFAAACQKKKSRINMNLRVVSNALKWKKKME